MTPRSYSSVTAFIAHWRALEEGARSADGNQALNDADTWLLRAMETTLAGLTDGERQALAAMDGEIASAGEAARRYQRAMLKLHRVLAGGGWLAG